MPMLSTTADCPSFFEGESLDSPSLLAFAALTSAFLPCLALSGAGGGAVAAAGAVGGSTLADFLSYWGILFLEKAL